MYQPIRQALVQPDTVIGAPRKPVFFLGFIAFLVGVMGGQWWIFPVCGALYVVMFFVNLHDPLLPTIIMRQIKSPSRPWRG